MAVFFLYIYFPGLDVGAEAGDWQFLGGEAVFFLLRTRRLMTSVAFEPGKYLVKFLKCKFAKSVLQ